MNDSTEQVMRGWRARQPSVELRKRIFASEAAPLEFRRATRDWTAFTRWLVPAMGCCFVLTGMALDPSTDISAGARQPVMSQQVAYSVEAGRKGWGGCKNTVPAKNLEWTFGFRSSSSTGSFVGSDTNKLRK
jgi:hypothetical protein